MNFSHSGGQVTSADRARLPTTWRASYRSNVVASATLGGDWFELGSGGFWRLDREALGSQDHEGPDGPRTVFSWRALTRMISGADAYVSCTLAAYRYRRGRGRR